MLHRNVSSSATPRATEYSNLAVTGTLLVRGKQFSQDLESVQLTVLDLTTLNDMIITGNQETDGTSLFNGAVTFQAPVTFHASTVIPVHKTVITPSFNGVTGSITILKQLNFVDITFSLQNNTCEGINAPTVLFTLPLGCTPSSTFSFNGDAKFSLDQTTSSVLYADIVSWKPASILNAHVCYLSCFNAHEKCDNSSSSISH
jgi:hypothetical protein